MARYLFITNVLIFSFQLAGKARIQYCRSQLQDDESTIFSLWLQRCRGMLLCQFHDLSGMSISHENLCLLENLLCFAALSKRLTQKYDVGLLHQTQC